MKHLFKHLFLYLFGSIVYLIMELIHDGSSDITMFILGGFCFLIGGLMNEVFTWQMSLILQGVIIGVFIITPLELLFGILFNQDYHIWDYRNLPFNFMGHICLQYTVIWCFMGILIVVIDDYLRYYIFKEEKPRYVLFRNKRS